jgi:hypothetical protein
LGDINLTIWKRLFRNPSHPPFFKGRRDIAMHLMKDTALSPFEKGDEGGF